MIIGKYKIDINSGFKWKPIRSHKIVCSCSITQNMMLARLELLRICHVNNL